MNEKRVALIGQFSRAITRLEEVLALSANDVVRDSAIQRFEFSFDLAWKVLKLHLEDEFGIVCASPKKCFREAYKQGLLPYDNFWIELTDLRNETSHTYNEKTAERVFGSLPEALKHFQELFKLFR